MASFTQSFPAFPPSPDRFSWEVPGKRVGVRLDLDIVDRMESEVLHSFGGTTNLGAEIGGLLLGSVIPHEHGYIVQITDFETVPLGPDQAEFTLHKEEEDWDRFAQAAGRWAWTPDKQTYAVGLFRSHARQGLGLVEQDYDLFQRYFPDPSAVVLLVKPFATRASLAGFFFREEGGIHGDSSYLEFPFRRRELVGEWSAPPDSADMAGTAALEHAAEGIPSMATATSVLGIGPDKAEPMPSDELKFGLPTSKIDESSGKRLRSGWVWIPLSFIFLLLGVVLGFQVALSVRSHVPAGFRQDPYALNLSISPAGDSLHIRWDRNSPAVQAATRGWLSIQDGAGQKTVDLDVTQLQNGSVIYRRASSSVRFRLEVLAGGRVTVGESLDFRSATK